MRILTGLGTDGQLANATLVSESIATDSVTVTLNGTLLAGDYIQLGKCHMWHSNFRNYYNHPFSSTYIESSDRTLKT